MFFGKSNIKIETLPNLLTTFRLILIPLFAFATFKYDMRASVFVLFLSGFTDMLDGYIAKKFKASTRFGEGYDPLVDKIMQICIVVCLFLKQKIPCWFAFLLVLKESAMILIGTVFYIKKISVKSSWYGKLGAIIFYFSIFFLLIKNKISDINKNPIIFVLFLGTIIPGFGYLIKSAKKNQHM